MTSWPNIPNISESSISLSTFQSIVIINIVRFAAIVCQILRKCERFKIPEIVSGTDARTHSFNSSMQSSPWSGSPPQRGLQLRRERRLQAVAGGLGEHVRQWARLDARIRTRRKDPKSRFGSPLIFLPDLAKFDKSSKTTNNTFAEICIL